MYDSGYEPKPLLRALEPLYRRLVPLSWPVIRLAAGVILFVHGWQKIGHAEAVTANMIKNGIPIPVLSAYIVIVIETIGAACVTLGLLTRFFAAACAIELAVITFHVVWPKGFTWSQGGYEYFLMWTLIMFAIALRGGGPYSLDRVIGRQL